MTSPKEGELALKSIKCPKCTSEKNDVIMEGLDYLHGIPGTFYVSECVQCGLRFQNPRPREEDIERLYPVDYIPHIRSHDTTSEKKTWSTVVWEKRKVLFRLFVNWCDRKFTSTEEWQGVRLITPSITNGKLLEIGCARGDRLISLRKRGWEHLYGIELAPEAVQQAQERGFNVICGKVEEGLSAFPDQYFDVIITSFVLEHLVNPFETVREIATKLKPGGQFLFSTVCCESLDAKIFGSYWAGFDFPRHMVHFRMQDIKDMVGDDFDDLTMFYQNAPVDFARSASWRKSKGDSMIRYIADSIFGDVIGYILVKLRKTTRISFRCIRKN